MNKTATENALMKIIIKSLVSVIIDMLDHAANLSAWKAAYFIMQTSMVDSRERYAKEERYGAYADRYKAILTVLEEAALFLDGNEFINRIVSLEKVKDNLGYNKATARMNR